MDIVFSSTTQLAAAIRAKRISAVEAVEAYLAQIEKYNPAFFYFSPLTISFS